MTNSRRGLNPWGFTPDQELSMAITPCCLHTAATRLSGMSGLAYNRLHERPDSL